MLTEETVTHEGQPAVAGFEGFFRSEYPRLVRSMYLVTGDRHRAEDVAQEAFARVVERWPRVQAMEVPTGYLYRIALNLSRRAFAGPHVLIPLHGSASDPAGDTDPADLRIEVHRALQALPREQREALVLVDWLGMDSKAAAQLLCIAPVSVRGRLHRARRTLRTSLSHWRTFEQS